MLSSLRNRSTRVLAVNGSKAPHSERIVMLGIWAYAFAKAIIATLMALGFSMDEAREGPTPVRLSKTIPGDTWILGKRFSNSRREIKVASGEDRLKLAIPPSIYGDSASPPHNT